MPWTADDMAQKGAKKPAEAAAIANDVRRRCLASGKGEKECDRMAIVYALGKVNRGA